MKVKFSEKEIQMFTILGFASLFTIVNEPSLYRIVIEECFCKNLTGPAVESLRRCVVAMNTCKIYRLTPEWDAMIQL